MKDKKKLGNPERNGRINGNDLVKKYFIPEIL
jgi:hypothetical protein